MPAKPWYDQYRTDIPAIDDLHEEMYQLVNRLYDDVLAKKPATASNATLTRLVDVTRRHFDQEEADMRRTAYPEAETHTTAHRSFRDQLSELAAQVSAGRPVTGAALDVMGSYLRQHAKVHDMKLAKHLKEHGSVG